MFFCYTWLNNVNRYINFYLIDIYYSLTKALGKDIEPKFGPDRPGDIKHSNADISKAREILGYDPEYDFARGLNEAIEWYKANL